MNSIENLIAESGYGRQRVRIVIINERLLRDHRIVILRISKLSGPALRIRYMLRKVLS